MEPLFFPLKNHRISAGKPQRLFNAACLDLEETFTENLKVYSTEITHVAESEYGLNPCSCAYNCVTLGEFLNV